MPQEAIVKLLALLVASPIVFLINVSPIKAVQLDFSADPTLTSGNNLSAGAEYTYSNVGTLNGITIGATLIIDDLKNSAFLGNIDADNNNNSGVPANIQPELNGLDLPTTPGSEPRAEFTIRFFNLNTNNLVLLDGLEVSGIDIDGNSGGVGIREGIRFYDATSVSFGSSLEQTGTSTNSRGSYSEIFSIDPIGNPGLSATNQDHIATAIYPNQLNSFKFDYLFRTGGGNNNNNTRLPTINSLQIDALSATEVPFQFSPTLGLFISLMSISGYQLRKKQRIKIVDIN